MANNHAINSAQQFIYENGIQINSLILLLSPHHQVINLMLMFMINIQHPIGNTLYTLSNIVHSNNKLIESNLHIYNIKPKQYLAYQETNKVCLYVGVSVTFVTLVLWVMTFPKHTGSAPLVLLALLLGAGVCS